MEEKEMYQQSKLMFPDLRMPSKFLKQVTILVMCGTAAIVVLYSTGIADTCPVKQIEIVGELKKYDQTKDPDLCAQLNNEISQFDNDCKGNLEILDCG